MFSFSAEDGADFSGSEVLRAALAAVDFRAVREASRAAASAQADSRAEAAPSGAAVQAEAFNRFL